MSLQIPQSFVVLRFSLCSSSGNKVFHLDNKLEPHHFPAFVRQYPQGPIIAAQISLKHVVPERLGVLLNRVGLIVGEARLVFHLLADLKQEYLRRGLIFPGLRVTGKCATLEVQHMLLIGACDTVNVGAIYRIRSYR